MSSSSIKKNVWVVLLSSFPLLALGGDSGDDFSNNLISDLGPLLQLFGERFAQQFMSQSMSGIDSFIFAIAPLGIITAIVGAIRVGGPSWLRAVIGRARENKGEAEIELMSSTSDEVCELWNGQTIVRTMGKPEVLQVVYYLEKEGDKSSFRLCSVEELTQIGAGGVSHRRATSQHTQPPQIKGIDEDVEQRAAGKPVTDFNTLFQAPLAKTLHELDTYAPNVSLNNTPERGRFELWVWALCGMVIQGGVLVVASIVTRILELDKDGEPVKAYALPLIIIGTVLLGLGMFYCASIVEKGSKEKRWSPKGDKTQKLRVLWLQRSHVVSDQCFDAFALIARGSRKYILTSHPASAARTGSEGSVGIPSVSDGGELIKTPSWQLGRTSQHLISKKFQVATVLGTFISLCGFVIQFVGLRASHWSISVAQLIATSLMTLVRVIVRRGLLQRPHAEPMIPNHEMDWLATRMARNPESFWSSFSDQNVGVGYSISRKPGTYCPHRWTIVTGHVNDSLLDGTWGENQLDKNSVVDIRQVLGRLSKWTAPVSEQAVSVAMAIEVVLDALLVSPKDEIFSWSLKSLYGENEAQVSISARYSNGRWKVDATRIEAILSLWFFHVRETEEERREDHRRTIQFHSSKQLGAITNDWLREGGSTLKKLSMRVLSPNTIPARQNLEWWVGLSEAQIQTATTTETNGTTTLMEIDRHRLTGCVISESLYEKVASTTTSFTCCRSDSLKLSVGEVDFQDSTISHNVGGDLVVISNPSLQYLFGQHVFSSLMWAISGTISSIGGETNLIQNDPLDWTNFRLENSTIRRIVQGVQQAGFGTVEEIYTHIIPPLVAKDRLPSAIAVVDLARKQARYHESLQQWQKATEAYLWLFQTSKAFNPKGQVAVKATALLMENFGFVNSSVELGRQQLQENSVMEELRVQMLQQLKTADMEVLTAVGQVYAAEQLDGWSAATLKTLGISLQRQTSTLYDKILMRSSSHSKVFSSESNTSDGDFNGMDVNVVDILGRTPLHYSILLTYDRTTKHLISLGADPNARTSLEWTPLHYACWFGNESVVWQLLRGADVDSRGTDGATPLHCATKRGHNKMVSMLLDTGANVQVVDNSRKSALHWAAFHGFDHIVSLLLKAGAPANARDNQGRTPLHLSAVTGREAVTMSLLEGGADAAANDRRGASPQQLAAENNHHGLAKVLMEWRSRETNVKRQAPLSWASENGHEEVVRKLVEGKIVNPNARDDRGRLTPLASAAQNGHAGVVAFLAAQADVEKNIRDENGRTPISLAAEKGHNEVVVALAEYGGADGEDNNLWTPLSWAAEMGHASVVKALVQRDDVHADKRNNKNRTPLSLAAAAGREEVVKILAKRPDVDPDAQDDTGRTPLSYAAGEGYDNIVEFLMGLERVNADGRDCFAQTALSWAAEAGYVNIVRLLAERGKCNPDSKDVYGQAPLSWTAEKGHDNVVHFLLSRDDVDINWTDKDGQTAIWWAADQGQENSVKALLECPRVKPDLAAKNGQTPLMRAAKKGHDSVVNVLTKRPDTDANAEDEAGRTPLSLAAEQGHERVVKALMLVDGIQINAKDNNGRTPLSWAAGNGHESTVRVLLNRLDIDVTATDSAGHLPLWWARRYTRRAIIEVLEHFPVGQS